MKKDFFKILTFSFHTILLTPHTFASTFSPSSSSIEKFKNYLRLNIFAHKDEISFNSKKGLFEFETLNYELFKNLKDELKDFSSENPYVKNIDFLDKGYPENPVSVRILFNDQEVEVFSYYKEKESKYILDFWKENHQTSESPTTQISLKENLKIAKRNFTNPIKSKGKVKKEVKKEIDDEISNEDSRVVTASKKKDSPLYRDFRYGASLIWNYSALIPELTKIVHLESKTPDYFYPIEDRAYEKDEKEAHMQLTINLYRSEKWGLMNKSINLYMTKYGEDSNFYLNEFLKSNSILKSNINSDKEDGPVKAAIINLSNIADMTQEYIMKRGIYQYLLSYLLEKKDYIQCLQLAKKLYVESKTQFDEEVATYAAEIILFNLGKLNQIDKIKDFVNEKSIRLLIPGQVLKAYEYHSLLSNGQIVELIKDFETNSSGFVKPVHPSIIFNTAEAYFQNAEFDKANHLFSQFNQEYSHHLFSSHSKLRTALIKDLTNDKIDNVLNAYKEVINTASDPAIRYEAKIRYVGITRARKIHMDENDLESIIFLEHDSREEKIISPILKKILWIVRLRSLINEKEYQKALAYIQALPVQSMPPLERKIFEGDGAEIIFGLINNLYNKTQYGQVVKLWEDFKDVFIDKVAEDPRINYIVTNSYLNLGLSESFDRSLTRLSSIRDQTKKLFPIWIEEGTRIPIATMVDELKMAKYIQSGEWDKANETNQHFMKQDPHFKKGDFFDGVISYELKKYDQAIKSFEKYMVNSESDLNLDQKDTAQLFHYYIESLYNTNNLDRFKKYTSLILDKVEIIPEKSPYIQKMRERVSYLYMEVLAGTADLKTSIELEDVITKFLKNYPQSIYNDRATYLLGLSKVRSEKEEEGISILNKLISKNNVPEYLKELARAELVTQKFKKKNI